MLAVLHVFLQIALRRGGPEDLPDSRLLLLLAALAYEITQTLLILAFPDSSPPALLGSLVLDLLLLCLGLWGLLKIAGRSARYGQTLTALFGTGALLGFCMLPFKYWIEWAGDPVRSPLAPAVGMLALIGWSLAVNGHIFSRALSIPSLLGMLVAIGYFFLNFLVFSQFGPAPA